MRSIRYLMLTSLPMLGLGAGVGVAGLTVTCLTAGGGAQTSSICGALLMMALALPLMYGTTQGSLCLSIALSMGETRRGYFWGLQGNALIQAAAYTALTFVFLAVPGLLGMGWASTFFYGLPWPLFFAVVLVCAATGPVLGLATYLRRKVGILLLCVASVGMVTFLLLIVMATVSAGRLWAWGDLRVILWVITGVILAASEIGMWNMLGKVTVK